MKEKIINKIKSLKKGKIIMTITIGIACFALVLVMTMQFKIVNETDIYINRKYERGRITN